MRTCWKLNIRCICSTEYTVTTNILSGFIVSLYKITKIIDYKNAGNNADSIVPRIESHTADSIASLTHCLSKQTVVGDGYVGGGGDTLGGYVGGMGVGTLGGGIHLGGGGGRLGGVYTLVGGGGGTLGRRFVGWGGGGRRSWSQCCFWALFGKLLHIGRPWMNVFVRVLQRREPLSLGPRPGKTAQKPLKSCLKNCSKITARNERFFKQDLSGLSGFSKKNRPNRSNH